MRLAEIKRNILNIPHPEYRTVHCVSADLKMEAGVAALIREKYTKEVREMEYKRDAYGGNWPKVGSAINAPSMGKSYNVYHLVTKQDHYGKTNYITMAQTLWNLKRACLADQTKKLAMPTIGCGHDELEWPRVRTLIKSIFSDTDIDIVVCHKRRESDG